MGCHDIFILLPILEIIHLFYHLIHGEAVEIFLFLPKSVLLFFVQLLGFSFHKGLLSPITGHTLLFYFKERGFLWFCFIQVFREIEYE